MATLVLQAAGQAAGGLLGPVGAIVGRAAGAIAGHAIDRRLFGGGKDRVIGRIDDLSVQTSTEGAPIARVYGRSRLAGEVIWASDFEETVAESAGGGKGGGPTVREYSYFANFAVGICEGPIARIGRVWADGEPLDLTKVTMRVHKGGDGQAADPLIEGLEGAAPAYRGLAYAVFERLPLAEFGNRLPQLTFEVVRPVGELENRLRAVTMIPGATEFGYAPDRVDRVLGRGEVAADNRHLGTAASDFEASLDELVELCPNLERVALVVAWFGSDLRAGECELYPAVEAHDRATTVPWQVAGLTREAARLVSAPGGEVSYGGTPSDAAVSAAIAAIKARGLKVVFYPFILMDVPPDNGLADPYGGAQQSSFPWRGRITLSSAPGMPGSTAGTAAADAEVAAFVGSEAPGAGEWSFRRMVLHYANLAAQAGGVDAFLIGSELRGLSTIRGASGFPFVSALSALADDVRSVVGASTKISYAADWSEYFGYQPGGDDVWFHLDPLWANPNIDFVGIDNYWPLSDWREGDHLDRGVAESAHDHAYLIANIDGGEGYDWYYASAADRDTQVRSSISDGAYGKDWVFRYKDLAGWWGNLHFDRTGGVEAAVPTAWVPGMKPVWFTEVGCPAVTFGANQPNVFYDPKSSESALPYHSTGRRDDAMQRAYLAAMLGAYDPDTSSDIDRFNPVSAVYGGRMVDHTGTHAWTWDARPWPAFPHRTDVWTDGDNWELGHWLNGRLGGAPFADLLAQLFQDWGFSAPDVSGVPVSFDGFVVSQPSSLRAVLEPLIEAASAVGADTGTGIRFVGLGGTARRTFQRLDLVDVGGEAPLLSHTRGEAFDLPAEVRLRYFDSGRAFRTASASYRPQHATTRQIDEIQLPASLSDGLAAELAERALAVRWSGRSTARFALPPGELALMPGDVVRLASGSTATDVLIEEIEDLGHREVTARSIDISALSVAGVRATSAVEAAPARGGSPFAFALNLPAVDESVEAHVPWIAVYSRPFEGPYGVWRKTDGGAFHLVKTVERAASVSEVVSGAPAEFAWRFDRADELTVRMLPRTLSAADEIDVLGGANALAVHVGEDRWEVLQFQSAELVAERTYRLSNLLRGQLGTEDAAGETVEVGAPVVLLDGTLSTLPTPRAEIGLERIFRVGPLADGLGGGAVTQFAFTPTGRGLAPYAPVHARARRDSSGDVTVTWIRRPREGGDAWLDGMDNPVAEAEERYAISILDGGAPLRAAEVLQPSFSYALADQLADYGSVPDALTLRVAQLAPGYGAGPSLEVTVHVQQS